MTFSESLRRFRKERGLTQRQVADAIGIREAVYQRYDQGKAVPSVVVVMKIADAFDVPLDYLTGRNKEEGKTNGEVYLLNDFRELNPEGQRSLIDYAEFLRIKHRSATPQIQNQVSAAM